MKQTLLVLSVLFLSLLMLTNIQAQDYQISFTGSGQSTTVNNIQVLNLAQGTSLTLNNSEVLHLVGMLTDIGSININENNLRVYPNPMAEKSNIEFFNSQKGQVIVEIVDATGKNVIRRNEELDYGNHTFEISGLTKGFYLVNLITSNGQFVEKLLSGGENAGNASISYKGNSLTSFRKSTLKSTQSLVQMQYNNGERLLVKGISGNYSRIITLIPTQNQAVNFEFITCSDPDNNHYPVVTIGAQTWMAENLRTTKYNDDAPIEYPGADDQAWENILTGAYAWYKNDANTYKNTLGALYNWFAVNTGKLCPAGWHVPTNAEWTTLENYLIANGFNYDNTTTENKMAKSLASTTGWLSSVTTGAVGNTDFPEKRNATGFSAISGSYRNFNGIYGDLGLGGSWWTATEIDDLHGWYRGLNYNNNHVETKGYFKRIGFSIRCMKD